MHVARSSTNFPVARLGAFSGDVAAAGFSAQSAIDSTNYYVSRTSMQVNLARTGFFHFNVAAAGSSAHRARDFSRPHVARSSLQTDFSGQIRELDVPGAALP